MSSTAWLALLAFSAPATRSCFGAENPSATDAPPAVVSWIREHAQPLTTVEAGHGFADLEPFRAMIGEARVVALGEPTHGSREVFQLKHRLIEYLVTELGFTVVAIEANMTEARRVDAYVSHGEGQPAELIRGMKFWTWATEEVRAMVADLRAFNIRPNQPPSGRRVEFTGFDLQLPSLPSTLVRDYVATHDPALLPTVDKAIAALSAKAPDAFGFVPPPPLESWKSVEARLTAATAKISAPADLATAQWITQCAHLVVQSLQMNAIPSVSRDESMARNVEWLLTQNPGAKIVLWAHNQHVKRAPEAMGGYLARHLGRDFVVVGFATARGAYRARSHRDRALGVFPLQAPPADSTESAFAATHFPLFLLDLRGARHADAALWLLANRPLRSIGAQALTEQFRPTLVDRDYDIMAWIEETSPSHPLPGGWPPAKS